MQKLFVNIKGKLNFDKNIKRLLITLLVVIIALSIVRPGKFLSFDNFQSIAYQFPEFGIMSLGIMLTMISAGIDLSVVGVANLAAIIAAMVLRAGAPKGSPDGQAFLMIIVCIGVGLAVGVICGLINGNLISRVGIPPILTTLGSMQLFTGIAIILTRGSTVSQLPLQYSKIMNSRVFGIFPVPFVIFVIVAVLVGYLLKRTKYGLRLYMMGSNQVAAKFSGLNNKRLLNRTYIYSGLLAAVSGLIMMGNYNSAKADYGSSYTLQSILIVVLGGVNPAGGFGTVWGVTLAIVILQFLSSGLNMFPSITNFYRHLIWGLLLLVVMVIDYFTIYKENKNISKAR